jgi:hypothetical protein
MQDPPQNANIANPAPVSWRHAPDGQAASAMIADAARISQRAEQWPDPSHILY